MIQLKICNLPLDEITAQLAMVMAFEDVRPLKGMAGLVDWRFNGKFSNWIRSSKFTGARGESLLMPTRGRLDSQELLFVGLGRKNHIVESEIPSILNFLVEKLMLKKSNSFVLSFSDFVPGMFEWRNTVRLFMSMISGRKEDLSVTLVEKTDFVEDARKRHMDFAFDVQVHYELVGE